MKQSGVISTQQAKAQQQGNSVPRTKQAAAQARSNNSKVKTSSDSTLVSSVSLSDLDEPSGLRSGRPGDHPVARG